jgi:hypothetical protein
LQSIDPSQEVLREQEQNMRGRGLSKTVSAVLLAGVVSAGSLICPAADEPAGMPKAGAANSGLYVKVQLNNPVKLSKLKPGDVLEGRLARDVYSSDREVFTSGSSVRLTVDHLEKRRRVPDDHWPGVVKLFTPRHQKYPVFKTATVSGGSGESALQVSVLSISRRRDVHAQPKKKGSGSQAGAVETSQAASVSGAKKAMPPTIVMEAVVAGDQKLTSAGGTDTSATVPELSDLETLPAGTGSKILLLGDVSASKSKPGDVIQARLLEPVLVNSRVVLPAGTLFEGSVVKKTPPRWGSRAGSLSLTFTGLTLPGGNLIPIAASLTGAELDLRSHTKIDPEGQLRGERPGKAWMAINIGVTAGLAKEADDTLQLIIEAFVSTATDASTAGVGRIAAGCVSGIYIVSRKGRDVVLPRFTEMNIALDRPLSVTRNAESATSTAIQHGN